MYCVKGGDGGFRIADFGLRISDLGLRIWDLKYFIDLKK